MKREGFTLIELLVVIAVIVLMMAILTAVLRIMKLRAEAVECQNNIRQLSLLLTMYEHENGTFPHALDDTSQEPLPGGFPGSPSYDRVGLWWINHIIDYSRKNRDKISVILCPSKKMNDIRLKKNVLCGNYGVNLSICKNSSVPRKSQAEFKGTPLSMSDIQRHSETLLIVDSGYSMINWWHVTDVPPISLDNSREDNAYVPGLKIKNEKTLWPDQEWDAIMGRHPNKKVNVGYVDGHVFVEKTGNGYNNRYPLWNPIKNNND